ncbi:19801_t:CDS:2 [Gigaspora margarita]|uniref:19801_t:CDS:1 n=1 Tax=Gigaspora margarita TaxID=4874 RepID=A0ABN7W2S3_GIGMA|nr:19801_t:CDS:2 [Gigaspora margarita]
MSETFVLTEIQNNTYSYPQKNGNPLTQPKKNYYRKAHTYFNRNVVEWKLITFCYFMDNQCGKVGRVNAFKKKLPTRSNEPVPFTKSKITLFKSEYEHFRRWPWIIPILSSIVDTTYPEDWIRTKFTQNEWDQISDTSGCLINKATKETISADSLSEIKNHFQQLRNSKKYLKPNKRLNEGSWQASVTTFTFTIISREFIDIQYVNNERQSTGSKRRRNLISSDEENYEITEVRRGKRPDFLVETVHGYRSTENFLKNKLLHFEYLIGEISKSPSNQSGEKSISNRYKMYKMMKDNYDTIVSYFYNQYGQYMHQDLSLRNLEIYGILVSGFDLEIFVLDRPGAVISRVRRVIRIEIPVNIENNDYYLWMDRLVYALNAQHSLLNKLIIKLKKKKSQDEEYKGFLFSTIPKSIGSP